MEERHSAFKRNLLLEELLRDLNSDLACAEREQLEHIEKLGRQHPIIFVMGPLRSGTTLFTQWLANTGIVAYPTNLLSRFYGAPVVGAKIQLLLTDPRYNFRDEILDFNSSVSYESKNGKTQGALAPNEFWYFWRRFLPFEELDWLPDDKLFRVADSENLVKELTALARVFGKPFMLKGMILNYNIGFLNAIFDNAIFVRIQRDPISNVASVLDARKRQFGNIDTWYSFKIPEYQQLIELTPLEQCAGQVHYTNKALSDEMNRLDDNKKLAVHYEDFCKNPSSVFDQLTNKLGLTALSCPYSGPSRFDISRVISFQERQLIENALLGFEAK